MHLDVTPIVFITFSRRSRYANAAFLRISTVIFAKAALIRPFNTGRFAGRVTYTFDFTSPHVKKFTRVVRSGECDGQGTLGEAQPHHV